MHAAIILAVQPDKILEFFKKTENFTSGIASRFLFTMLHNEERIETRFDAPEISDTIYSKYCAGVKKCLEKSFGVSEQEPAYCFFDDVEKHNVQGTIFTAAEYLRAVVNALFSETQKVSEEKIAWQNRTVSTVARLAALLSLWENIAEKGLEYEERRITFKNLHNALLIVNYFSETFDALMESGNKIQSDALEILSFIKSEKLISLTKHDIIAVLGRYGKRQLEYLNKRLRFLEEREYIQMEQKIVPGRGKPIEIIHVNPKIYE
jgi:hypothetical protein